MKIPCYCEGFFIFLNSFKTNKNMWSKRKKVLGLPLGLHVGTDGSVVMSINNDGGVTFRDDYLELPAPNNNNKPKWVTLSNDSLSLMQLLDVDVEMLKGEKADDANGEEFVPGAIYSLGTESVEGVEFGRLYFKLYGVIKEYKGVNIDSLILKEVGIDENGNLVEGINTIGRRKFSMSPAMCKMMGLKYSPGFELWPINSGFERVDVDDIIEEDKEIVYEDMSTYPTSEIDGTIRKIILELHGFSPYNNSHIITPTGAMIPTNDFVSSLTIFARQNISTDNGCAGFRIGEQLPFKIVGRDTGSKVFTICDDKHNIYVEVDLTKKSLNANTSDGVVGVAHTALDGKDVDDVIGVKWDESNDENKPKEKPKVMSVDDIDRVFGALDKHFGRMDEILSRSSKVGYWNGMKILDY